MTRTPVSILLVCVPSRARFSVRRNSGELAFDNGFQLGKQRRHKLLHLHYAGSVTALRDCTIAYSNFVAHI